MTTINPLTTSPSTLPQSTATTPSGPAAQDIFQSVLSALLVSAATGSESGQPALAPVMAVLLDQLAELQARAGDAAPLAPETLSTSQALSNPNLLAPAGRPVEGGQLTQGFHSAHNGLDFGVPIGTPVASTMDGTVIYSGWNDQGYGNLMIVESGPYRTYYAHLSETLLPVGEQVRAGTVIARSGNTGNSTGPHLHYEIRYQRQAINPAGELQPDPMA